MKIFTNLQLVVTFVVLLHIVYIYCIYTVYIYLALVYLTFYSTFLQKNLFTYIIVS